MRSCIVLHNLILRYEGDNIDEDWYEELWDAGRHNGDSDDGDDEGNMEDDIDEDSGDDELQRAQRRVLSEGQRFRLRKMKELFDSPTSGAVRRE